ncbi:MAG: nucleotidyltransferase domain-containing protein [Nitrospirae bacterium]|nr:nucleotidyltransferase domain-containing protein [Nitrospirota bacterium]MDA8339347.1 nucleotidyltransferase domain-containing protein [Nitrospiraceae bacterium]
MNEHDVKRLTECLCKYPVIIAYLFGSEAKGTSGVLSDIDVAVFISKDIDKSERFDLRLRLSNELSSSMNKRVDFVVLNDSPVQLSYEVIKHGKLIFCKDKSMKVDLEVEILSRYLDRRYYDKRHAELVMEKIALRGF